MSSILRIILLLASLSLILLNSFKCINATIDSPGTHVTIQPFLGSEEQAHHFLLEAVSTTIISGCILHKSPLFA